LTPDAFARDPHGDAAHDAADGSAREPDGTRGDSGDPSGTPILLLLGLRASGKTTLGAEVAKRRGARFIDLDALVAERLGHGAAGAALRAVGERMFRLAEAELLVELLAAPRTERAPPTVIALGGGTPTAPGARERLDAASTRGAARIILLNARVEVLLERMTRSGVDRPALTTLSPREEIDHLAAERLGAYRSLADSELDTSDLDFERSVRALESLWAAPRSRD